MLSLNALYFPGCGKNVRFDLGFAIDGSNSIDNNEYRLTKDFVKDIIQIFSVSEQGTHVGLLEYASEAFIKAYFDEYEGVVDATDLLRTVEDLTHPRGASTNIGRGLQRALDMFSVDYGMRNEVNVTMQ